MRFYPNSSSGCGSQIQVASGHRPIALDLAEATAGLEETGESQMSIMSENRSVTELTRSLEVCEPSFQTLAGQRRNRKSVNDQARAGCASRLLTTKP